MSRSNTHLGDIPLGSCLHKQPTEANLDFLSTVLHILCASPISRWGGCPDRPSEVAGAGCVWGGCGVMIQGRVVALYSMRDGWAVDSRKWWIVCLVPAEASLKSEGEGVRTDPAGVVDGCRGHAVKKEARTPRRNRAGVKDRRLLDSARRNADAGCLDFDWELVVGFLGSSETTDPTMTHAYSVLVR